MDLICGTLKVKSAQVWPHAILIVAALPLRVVGIQLCANACNDIIVMQAIALSLSKVSLIKCVSVNVGCPKKQNP